MEPGAVRWDVHSATAITISQFSHSSYCVTLFSRTAVKSTIILLPLLGITWLFGSLAVNENTTVFAWLFTVCNSLQVRTLCSVPVIDWVSVKKPHTSCSRAMSICLPYPKSATCNNCYTPGRGKIVARK